MDGYGDGGGRGPQGPGTIGSSRGDAPEPIQPVAYAARQSPPMRLVDSVARQSPPMRLAPNVARQSPRMRPVEIDARRSPPIQPVANVAKQSPQMRSVKNATKQSAPISPPNNYGKYQNLSKKGLDYITKKEGTGAHAYWPHGNSGVTIGHGYDFKDRTSAEIEFDLRTIGVDPNTARILAKGSGLTGEAAKQFSDRHENDISLSQNQQDQLFGNKISIYINQVRSEVKVPISQGQFDALVSFVYNEGFTNFKNSTLLKRLNEGDYTAAAHEFQKWTKSKGSDMQGLVTRRSEEMQMFLHERYP